MVTEPDSRDCTVSPACSLSLEGRLTDPKGHLLDHPGAGAGAGTGAGVLEEGCFLCSFLGHTQLALLHSPGPHARDAIAHSGLAHSGFSHSGHPSTSTSNQENAPQTCLQDSLIWAISQVWFPLPWGL